MHEQEKQRKIALVGTSCVGKSSIFDHLKSLYQNNPNIAFVDEAARIYFRNNPQMPEEKKFSFQPQSEIQLLAFHLEQQAHNSGSSRIVTDRSVLDAAVYVRTFGDIEGSKKLVERVRSWIPTYSNILLLDPKGIPYEQDDIRKEDPITRQKNHDAFLEFFMGEGISYELLGGTLDQKIQRVDNLLSLA